MLGLLRRRDHSLGRLRCRYWKGHQTSPCAKAPADDTIDSFEARIHEAEYKLYPEVLDSLGVARK